jgi:transposase
MIYREKEKNKNQKMGKHLARHFSSLGFHLLISFVAFVAIYLEC